MHTEEFVLVPRQMYSEEQPQVSQVLRNQNIANKSAYLSVLQRNQQSQNDAKAASSRVKYDATTATTPPPETSTVQTEATMPKLNETGTSPGTEYVSFNQEDFFKTVLEELSLKMQGTKLDRTRTIMQLIGTNDRLIGDPKTWRINYGRRNTRGPRIDAFLYNIQQNTKLLSYSELVILYELKIDNQLVANTNAKQFLSLSSNEQLKYLDKFNTQPKQPTANLEFFMDTQEDVEVQAPPNWKPATNLNK